MDLRTLAHALFGVRAFDVLFHQRCLRGGVRRGRGPAHLDVVGEADGRDPRGGECGVPAAGSTIRSQAEATT